MSSYLKFNGQQDSAEVTVQNGAAVNTITLTAFFRVLDTPPLNTPIIQIVDFSSSTATLLGVFLVGPAGGNDVTHHLGVVRVGTTINVGSSPTVLRIGRVYKIQLMHRDTDGVWSLGLDGVRIATGGSGGAMALADWIYCLAGERGSINALPPLRAAHCDIIQAKVEVNRTFTDSGGFPTVDADSDPFTAMTLPGSPSVFDALWLMNEGTGDPQDTSGNGYHLTLSGTSWAPAADPSFPSVGTARWSFESIDGYDLRAADAPTITPMPIPGPAGPVGDDTAGELQLAQKVARWREDGEQTTQFDILGNLSTSTAQVFATRRALLTDGVVAANAADVIFPDAGATTEEFWFLTRFYDPGGSTAGRLQQLTLFTVLNAIVVRIGVFQAQSSTHYVASVGTTHTVTSVARAVGWHELLMYVSEPNSGNATIRFYIAEAGSTAVHSDTGTDITRPERVGIRNAGVSATSDQGYWDSMRLGYRRATVTDAMFAGLVEPTGSIILPVLQPAGGIGSFLGVTITEATAGTTSLELGTTAYTFRHSTDGGSSWSSPATLNTANLQALDAVGAGRDVLEITVTQTSSMDDMGTPATRQIDVTFTPFIIPRIMHHRNQIAGVCC